MESHANEFSFNADSLEGNSSVDAFCKNNNAHITFEFSCYFHQCWVCFTRNFSWNSLTLNFVARDILYRLVLSSRSQTILRLVLLPTTFQGFISGCSDASFSRSTASLLCTLTGSEKRAWTFVLKFAVTPTGGWCLSFSPWNIPLSFCTNEHSSFTANVVEQKYWFG